MIKVDKQSVTIDGSVIQIFSELSTAGAVIGKDLKENNVPRDFISGLFMRVLSNSLLDKTISGDLSDREIFDMIEAWVNEEQPATLN